MKVKIIQLGDVQSNLVELVSETMNKRFKNKFYFGGKADIPDKYFNKFKNQYDSQAVLDFLSKHL